MITRVVESWRVFGIPKGQPRVRTFSRGRHAGVYDPGQANGWKACIAYTIGGGRKPYPGPLALMIDFYFPYPKRLEKAALRGEILPHTSKPDLDNAIKAVMDAMTELSVWTDDSQVAFVTACKHYASTFVAPGATISVSRIIPEKVAGE